MLKDNYGINLKFTLYLWDSREELSFIFTSLKERVEIFVEQMYDNVIEKAVSGTFTLVAIDTDKKQVKINV
jgi:hypothetical protein